MSLEHGLKIPPHSDEAEKHVIGSILLDPQTAFPIALESGVVPETFHDRRYQAIFENLIEMQSSGKYMDAITIAEYIKNKGFLDKCGGYETLSDAQNYAGVSESVEFFSDIILEKKRARMVLEAIHNGSDSIYNGKDELDVICADIARTIDSTRPPDDSGNVIDLIMAECEDAMSGKIRTVPTPIPSVTMMTGGFRRKMFHVLTGKSKSGKSMFKAWHLNFLGKEGIPTLDCCFEDGNELTLSRRAANLGNYDHMKCLNGGSYSFYNGRLEWVKVTRKELENHRHWLNEASKIPVYHIDKKSTPAQIYSTVDWYVRKHGVQCVYIDGAKDVIRPSGKYNDTGFDEEISQGFASISRKFDIALIGIYHLTKILDSDLITKTNVRGSGNIVSDCRSIWAFQSGGIEQQANEKGIPLEYTDEGWLKTRRLDCLDTNHGQACSKWLQTDLKKCQFYSN